MRSDLYWLTRFRITTAVTPSPTVSFQMQLQHARVGHKTVGPTAAPFRAPFDQWTAFAQIGSTTSPLAVRLGRQELASNYHSWWLAERRAAVLSDLPQLQVAGGYAHVFPGDFLRQATPGASYSHPYVMVTYVFLAER